MDVERLFSSGKGKISNETGAVGVTDGTCSDWICSDVGRAVAVAVAVYAGRIVSPSPIAIANHENEGVTAL